MGKKINVAELLKDCPQGMELDCTMFEGLEFDSISEESIVTPILCRIKLPNGNYNTYNFTKYGCWSNTEYAKCVIFPKGKTTWDGFVPPCKFKAGDILYIDCSNKKSDGDLYKYIFILKEIDSLGNYFSYCHLFIDGLFSTTQYLAENKYTARFATEEEKEKLFKAIRDNGYQWNPETKTLEKLVPNKFDITTLKPFDKVLTRANDNDAWVCNLYSHRMKDYYVVLNAELAKQCIPYEENQHLLGTSNDCDDFYKTW